VPRLATTLGALCLAASVLVARSSAAQTTPEPIAWTYHAPPDCPSAETFERDFRDRTRRAELVAGDAPRSFLVTLSNEPGRAVGRSAEGGAAANLIVGRIEIQGPAGALATRVVAGQTCRGVVSALALIAALAVDPLADSSERAARPSEGVPTPSPVPPSEEDIRGGEAPPRRAVVAAGVDGGAVVGLFPKPSPRVSLFVEARFERLALAPSARLSLSAAVSSSAGEVRPPTGSSVAAPPGSATFRWWAAALDGCPFEVRFARALRATPCVFFELGTLAGSGTGVSLPAAESRRWIALGGSTKVNWLVHGSFFLEAHGRLEAPLARDTFVLAAPERVVVHAVPAVVGSLELGAGVRWP
jgi:hypothetical protein